MMRWPPHRPRSCHPDEMLRCHTCQVSYLSVVILVTCQASMKYSNEPEEMILQRALSAGPLSLLTHLLACLLTCLLSCLLPYLLTYFFTYLLTYLLIYLPTYLPTYPLTYSLTYLPTYLLTYLLSYSLTYLRIRGAGPLIFHIVFGLLATLFMYIDIFIIQDRKATRARC